MKHERTCPVPMPNDLHINRPSEPIWHNYMYVGGVHDPNATIGGKRMIVGISAYPQFPPPKPTHIK